MKYLGILLRLLIFIALAYIQLVLVLDFHRRGAVSLTSDVSIPCEGKDSYAEVIPISNKDYFLYKTASGEHFLKKIPCEGEYFKLKHIAIDHIAIRIVMPQKTSKIIVVKRGDVGLELKETKIDFSWFSYFSLLIAKILLCVVLMFAAFKACNRITKVKGIKWLHYLDIIIPLLFGIFIFLLWYCCY